MYLDYMKEKVFEKKIVRYLLANLKSENSKNNIKLYQYLKYFTTPGTKMPNKCNNLKINSRAISSLSIGKRIGRISSNET